MNGNVIDGRSRRQLLKEIEDLRARLEEAEQTLTAIQLGEVDALVIKKPEGEQVYSLSGVERVYRMIVETMNEAALTVSAEGIILFCNQRFAELTHVPMHEVVGRKLAHFIESSEYARLEELLKMAQTAPSRCRLLLHYPDAIPRPAQFSANPLVTESGQSVCIVVTDLAQSEAAEEFIRFLKQHGKELEESKQALEASEQRFRILFENNVNPTFLSQPDGLIYAANKAAWTTFGYSSQEDICSVKRDDLLDTEDPRYAAGLKARSRTGSIQGWELTAIRKDGQKFPAEVDSVVIPGEPTRSFVILRDITERKRAEQQLARDLDAMTRLQKLGSLYVRDGGLEPILNEMVDAAIAIAGADFGNIQLLDPATGTLRIAAQHGLPPYWLEFWQNVGKGVGVSGSALERGESVIVEDVEQSPIFIGTPGLEMQRRAGVRAVQSTPLVNRFGKPVGTFSTHYKTPHRPDERTLRLLDLLARQAADIIERFQAEAALRESEEQFRVLTQNLMSAVALINERGEFSIVNRAFLRLFDLAEDADPLNVNNRDWSEWQVFDESGQLLEVDEHPVRKAALTRTAIRDMLVAVQPPGGTDRKWLLVSAEPILDANGNLHRLICTYHDITEQKQAEEALHESEHRLRLAQQIAQIGTCDYNFLTGENTWTPEVEALYGLKPGEFGKTLTAWENLLHPDDRPKAMRLLSESIKTGLPTTCEWRTVWGDGSVHWVAARWQVYKDQSGHPLRVVGINMDITERKRSDEALHRLMNHLNEKVEERTADLHAANQKLEQRASQLRELAGELTTTEQRERKAIAKLLHDGLQQYLVAARMRQNLLINELGDQAATKSAQDVEGLLVECINVSRSLAIELCPPALDGGIMAGLEWLTRFMAGKHGLHADLVVETAAPVLPEKVKIFLFESIRELLLNVVKHSRTLSARVHLKENGQNLQVTVADAGVGFEAADLQPVQSGSGLGLFSIRERIGLVGGAIAIDSAPGDGARFTITVPLASFETAQPGPSTCSYIDTNASKSNGKIKVLLADDHKVMRESLAQMLGSEEDFEIVGQAEDGDAAVELAKMLRPQVLLMDIGMPNMDGVTATRIIAARHPEVNVIGLSFYRADERAEEMIKAGAKAYVSKTAPAEELKRAIRSCAGQDVQEKKAS